ncbi:MULTISPECIES: hypothetical protein [unclassified Streptomyces]|uniref:hypothetical protein n=1 Tax=unclassified Streptomyces TaxID=2593676 RepID=UPI003BB7F2EE
MTPAEQRRRELLGPTVLAEIDERVATAPEPNPGEWADQLRRIFDVRPAPLAEVSLPRKAA